VAACASSAWPSAPPGAPGRLLTYTEELRLENCTSTGAGAGTAGIRIYSVNDVTLYGCTPPFVSTADNDPKAFESYGASTSVEVK
jgi:hypothetical protein